MYHYSKRSNFTWNGTLKELGNYSCSERVRASMAAPGSSSGLEVLLSTLQNAGDIESTLNILNVLDELLSAGTDRRITYMISKGGSEALLSALVTTARTFSPNFTILLPLLHLLAKVGHRDRRIGMKAEKAEAVLPTLTLLKQNVKHTRRTAACLWVLQVFCSSVTTATLLGQNQGLDVIFRLIPPHTTRHKRTIKAAIDALAALLCSKANVRAAVAKGYVSALLKLYEDWHNKDPDHETIPIRLALLHCLHQTTRCSAGRDTLVAQGGISLLYHTTQTCLASKGLESLVEPAVQLMRKCFPKCPLPLTSDQSVYTFPLPGRPTDTAPGPQDVSFEDDSDDDIENEEADCGKEYDDDLESDVNKLRFRPEPDRPLEQLGQYVRLCPELHHDFQDLDSDSEVDSSSDEEGLLNEDFRTDGRSRVNLRDSQSHSPLEHPVSTVEGDQDGKGEPPENHLQACDFHSHFLSSSSVKQDSHPSMVDRLLEKHGACIPNHDPRMYTAAAALTKSIPEYSILAFPDFWGHLPPQSKEPMAGRKPNVQRKKVFEDVQRLLNPEDVIDEVVFDLEDPSSQGSPDHSDSLSFFSKFECGNLRKAVHVRSHEYDLILNADANCSQHHQWFYFEVSGMAANVPYRFNIINCEKANSQFNYGMQPVLYSVREALEGRPNWVRTGTEVCYYRNSFCPSRGQKSSSFYTLTFTVTFKHNEDVCYLAYHYPYTYSALQSHLQVLQRSVDPRKLFFRQQSLCNTLAGNPCPLVTITACPSSKSWKDLHQLRNRPCVVLTARVHPGESNASWVMKGTLEFLCSSDPVAETLREAYIFKIIPMLNPDGVINGTHRCSLNGEDLNRQWMKPDPVLSPTIYHAKGFLYYLNSIGRTPLVFCDYHGHSRKKNVFLYGCSVKETVWQSGSAVNTATLKEDPGYRTIPKTLDRIAPAFSFNSCNYLVEKSREATARVVVWREMGVLRSYTMESTYNGCDQGVFKGMQTGTGELEEMGVKFCQSLLSLRRNTMLYNRRVISQPTLLNLDDNLLDHKSRNCFEDDEPPCVEEIEYLNDSFPEPNRNDLDSEVNGNTSSAEEEEDDEEEHQPTGNSQRRSMKSRLYPHLIGQETLNIKRSPCNGMNISNGQYLS
ncbi:cytosolic carboxypeptidase 4 [Salmo salar]|uniref:tubulin-glutamate carboxypeptidase n=1 Tax=Salmo salar TaxID=8030 RepID=A0A1S3KMR8_SALSA|nr:cytosolic carboxypeptidase 4 [Salmo salar]